MKLFDTDVLIEHLRGNETARFLLDHALRHGDAACSVLTSFELLASMRSGERHAVRALLEAMDAVPVSPPVAARAGEWARTYRRSHAHIGAIDYLIAATAEIEGADLLTRNVRHYPMFSDLEPAL